MLKELRSGDAPRQRSSRDDGLLRDRSPSGVDRYLADAADAGVDGLIVPDLPVEEAGDLLRRAEAKSLKLIQLVTPTTPWQRALAIARTSTGFLYYVSVAGLTGERTTLPTGLAEAVARLRAETSLPICIGFGITSTEHIRSLAPHADGLIVGSALVRRLADAAARPRDQVVSDIGEFVADLAKGLEPRS